MALFSDDNLELGFERTHHREEFVASRLELSFDRSRSRLDGIGEGVDDRPEGRSGLLRSLHEPRKLGFERLLVSGGKEGIDELWKSKASRRENEFEPEDVDLSDDLVRREEVRGLEGVIQVRVRLLQL